MDYLTQPVKSFKKLAKRPRVSDAMFIVASVWVVLLGLQLARLASQDALTLSLVIRDTIVISIDVVTLWLATAGLGYLLVHAAHGKGEFNSMLVMAGLAATPLAILGIVAIGVQLVAAAVQLPDYGAMLVTRILLWAGLVLGTPGFYFALGLEALGGVKRVSAAYIAGFLTLAVILIILMQGNDFLHV